MHQIKFKRPDNIEFLEVQKLIEEYQLDNRNLKKEEFIIALKDDSVSGFGRIKEFDECIELCSIGILKTERNKGIGKMLVKYMIEQCQDKPVFLVCIIPEFFAQLGFKVVLTYPSCINEKKNYCTSQLAVPETYVVMQRI